MKTSTQNLRSLQQERIKSLVSVLLNQQSPMTTTEIAEKLNADRLSVAGLISNVTVSHPGLIIKYSDLSKRLSYGAVKDYVKPKEGPKAVPYNIKDVIEKRKGLNMWETLIRG